MEIMIKGRKIPQTSSSGIERIKGASIEVMEEYHQEEIKNRPSILQKIKNLLGNPNGEDITVLVVIGAIFWGGIFELIGNAIISVLVVISIFAILAYEK